MNINKPQLSMTHDRKSWVLFFEGYEGGPIPDLSFSLEIRHDAIQDVFTFRASDAGTDYELVTRDEFKQRTQDVFENENVESLDEAEGWVEEANVRVMTNYEADIKAKLTEYWVALRCLIVPAVNL